MKAIIYEKKKRVSVQCIYTCNLSFEKTYTESSKGIKIYGIGIKGSTRGIITNLAIIESSLQLAKDSYSHGGTYKKKS